ncbi:MAG: peptide deformylase [Acidaminococcus sp.]|jgi:peptide deformylase|nr:peptide deformylase [Acidaminococcus sp.]MCI2100469.1 peptide deformylase [Acidaminococcus sp.]MCI2114790.1 peptide deformylase [Acidaminococcus sp.]MCI2116843.1 peptide deformylase [Acidaminococcus sp.]
MSLLKIVKVGAPILRETAEPVTRFDKKLQKTLKNMAETMYAANGCGLAAPQIGLKKRMVVIDAGDGAGIREFVNPVLSDFKGEAIDTEGCLSVDEYEGEVKRAAEVTCIFQDSKGTHWKLEAHGLLARALQHECDHLDGILFIDKAISLTPKRKEE